MSTLSVIVPVYNVEEYLDRCVDSILAQTFADIEVILVDDGSPDNCGAICDKYAQQDSRVRVVHKKNGGLSDARNAGLDIASGDFVAFVDSDDWIDAGIYEYALNLQKEKNADIVEFGFQKVWCEEDALNYDRPEDEVLVCSGTEILPEIYRAGLGGSVVAWNKVYRRECFINVRFEKGRINEDALIMPQLFFEAKVCAASRRVGYFYFQGNQSSIMHQRFSVKKLDALYAFNSNRQFFLSHGLEEAKLWCDTTYAFVLVKYLKLIKSELGKEIAEYSEVKREYRSCICDFMRNPYLNLKQKILILYYRFFV